jgi:hypothetical protein
MLRTKRSRHGHRMPFFSNPRQLLSASIGDSCYKNARNWVRVTA